MPYSVLFTDENTLETVIYRLLVKDKYKKNHNVAGQEDNILIILCLR